MKERRPCYICEKHQPISHLHHVIPVSQMATLLTRAGCGLEAQAHLTVRVVWLCPNHHAIWHKINGTPQEIVPYLISQLSEKERDAYEQLQRVERETWAWFNDFLWKHGAGASER